MSALSGDADRDSLPDVLEQQLLERFMPRFQVAVDDCDLAPAEFGMGKREPKVVARNGTVYGQVFRVEGGIVAAWRGPEVWISRGKHASFLTEAACHAGCGSDRCDQSQAMQVRQLINPGEIGAPMNGADWVGSTAWALGEKLESNFSSELLEELDRSKGVIGAASSTMDAIDRASRAVMSWLWRRLD